MESRTVSRSYRLSALLALTATVTWTFQLVPLQAKDEFMDPADVEQVAPLPEDPTDVEQAAPLPAEGGPQETCGDPDERRAEFGKQLEAMLSKLKDGLRLEARTLYCRQVVDLWPQPCWVTGFTPVVQVDSRLDSAIQHIGQTIESGDLEAAQTMLGGINGSLDFIFTLELRDSVAVYPNRSIATAIETAKEIIREYEESIRRKPLPWLAVLN